MTLKAIIIGGGAGGTTLALALRHAGIDSTIFERDNEPSTSEGHLLSVGSNALDALSAIGIKLDGIPIPRLPCYSGTGKRLAELYNGAKAESAPTTLMICRGTLQQELRELCVDRGIRIEYGKELKSVDTGEQSVTAHFADGTTAEADVLIGADGVQSTTRRLLFPELPDASYTGILGVGGRSRTEGLEPTPEVVINSFGYKGFFSYHIQPDGSAQWLAFAPRKLPLAPGEVLSTEEWKQWLLSIYGKDMAGVREVIAKITGPVDVNPMQRVPALPARYRGRAALIGDATATTGRIGAGTAMAMEDAVVLAKCLRDVTSPEQAFATYQELRKPRVDRVVKWGNMNARPPKVRTPWGMQLRNLTWPFLFSKIPTLVSMDWLYGHHVDWQEPVVPSASSVTQ
jgi:2-polyprenyl-6-methoxyphenol hydroxylase-like FAD-dependent oxidoreductase